MRAANERKGVMIALYYVSLLNDHRQIFYDQLWCESDILGISIISVTADIMLIFQRYFRIRKWIHFIKWRSRAPAHIEPGNFKTPIATNLITRAFSDMKWSGALLSYSFGLAFVSFRISPTFLCDFRFGASLSTFSLYSILSIFSQAFYKHSNGSDVLEDRLPSCRFWEFSSCFNRYEGSSVSTQNGSTRVTTTA